jgi:hypothetical protein
MKKKHTLWKFLLFVTTFLPTLGAQSQVSQELSKAIETQNDKISQLKIQLLDLQKKREELKTDATKAIEDADDRLAELNELTTRLAKSPQDKKLNNEYKKADRARKRADKQASKASELLANTETMITTTEQQIEAETGRLSVLTHSTGSASGYGVDGSEKSGGDSLRSTNSPQPASSPTDVTPAGTDNNQMIRSIVEETYKKYPQQSGQPNVIINNIIIPSDYSARNEQRREAAAATPEELAEFRAWRDNQAHGYKDRYASRRDYSGRDYSSRETRGERDEDYSQRGENSFYTRFSELPKRKSGLWVIPLVGAHASSFEMDFNDNQAKGRGGWNAGLDFRAHFNRFFIQPGAHYFSSSMDVSTTDSLTTSPFTSGPRIHSLRVPVLAGVYLTKAQGAFFKFNVKGGIVGNYVLSVDKNDRNFTIDNLERYSYGVNGGIGLEFGFITLDLSHEWGISKYFKNSDGKNNMLRATLGFKL